MKIMVFKNGLGKWFVENWFLNFWWFWYIAWLVEVYSFLDECEKLNDSNKDENYCFQIYGFLKKVIKKLLSFDYLMV